MKRIASFEVDHNTLTEGVYLSRKDGDVTTWDIRFVKPNTPPFLEMPAVHTIEHLFATYVRNSRFSDRIIYFGPMGCRTGFYFLTRDMADEEVLNLIKETMAFIAAFEGDIPGVSAVECGNWKEHDLPTAKQYATQMMHKLQPKTAADMRY
ncbi:MAG: S-ribosylhomocysteine lyase [Ruminococcaceae bacterium]|nr:S-ribosylhomocysteine lyase [Oscillospiraceae bacterium]